MDQPNADFVKATGKCAECHSRQQYSIVHEYEMSKHAAKGVNCLDCYQPQKGQDADRQDRSRHERFLSLVRVDSSHQQRPRRGLFPDLLSARTAAKVRQVVPGNSGSASNRGRASFFMRWRTGTGLHTGSSTTSSAVLRFLRLCSCRTLRFWDSWGWSRMKNRTGQPRVPLNASPAL